MRVLVVHNEYRSAFPSGENLVVAADVKMLREAGLEVDTYFRSSDEIGTFGIAERAQMAIRPIYSLEDTRAFRIRIRETRPDVVHLHNPFPLISPWIIRVAKSEGLPVVQTVHNYRHSCPSGDFFRAGAICEECSTKAFPWPAIRYGCYRDSRPQSAVMAVAARLHRSTWQMVDRFLPVSEFVASRLSTYGIPRERITVRHNFTEDRGPVKPLGSDFVFVGRLTAEKGASLLMSAWRESAVWRTRQLIVAGDGPDRGLVQAASDCNVRYIGAVDRDRVSTLLDEAAVVVIPSLCYEGFPRMVAESFERARPVAASGIGGLGELISTRVGWTATPDTASFARMLSDASGDSHLEAKGLAAREVFESQLSARVAAQSLIRLYGSLVAGNSGLGET